MESSKVEESMMEELFSRVWEDLVGRAQGPMKLRLIIQPLVACTLAVRAGLKDARECKPPFIWALVFHPDMRRTLLRQAWSDIGKVFIACLILDVIYQAFVLRTFYVGEAIVVAILLAVVPYLLVRAPITRLFTKRKK